MKRFVWKRWRRDLLIGLASSFLTAALMTTVGWGASHSVRSAAADKALRETLDRAVNEAFEMGLGGGDKTRAEFMQVMTDAVAPEVPLAPIS